MKGLSSAFILLLAVCVARSMHPNTRTKKGPPPNRRRGRPSKNIAGPKDVSDGVPESTGNTLPTKPQPRENLKPMSYNADLGFLASLVRSGPNVLLPTRTKEGNRPQKGKTGPSPFSIGYPRTSGRRRLVTPGVGSKPPEESGNSSLVDRIPTIYHTRKGNGNYLEGQTARVYDVSVSRRLKRTGRYRRGIDFNYRRKHFSELRSKLPTKQHKTPNNNVTESRHIKLHAGVSYETNNNNSNVPNLVDFKDGRDVPSSVLGDAKLPKTSIFTEKLGWNFQGDRTINRRRFSDIPSGIKQRRHRSIYALNQEMRSGNVLNTTKDKTVAYSNADTRSYTANKNQALGNIGKELGGYKNKRNKPKSLIQRSKGIYSLPPRFRNLSYSKKLIWGIIRNQSEFQRKPLEVETANTSFEAVSKAVHQHTNNRSTVSKTKLYAPILRQNNTILGGLTIHNNEKKIHSSSQTVNTPSMSYKPLLSINGNTRPLTLFPNSTSNWRYFIPSSLDRKHESIRHSKHNYTKRNNNVQESHDTAHNIKSKLATTGKAATRVRVHSKSDKLIQRSQHRRLKNERLANNPTFMKSIKAYIARNKKKSTSNESPTKRLNTDAHTRNMSDVFNTSLSDGVSLKSERTNTPMTNGGFLKSQNAKKQANQFTADKISPRLPSGVRKFVKTPSSKEFKELKNVAIALHVLQNYMNAQARSSIQYAPDINDKRNSGKIRTGPSRRIPPPPPIYTNDIVETFRQNEDNPAHVPAHLHPPVLERPRKVKTDPVNSRPQRPRQRASSGVKSGKVSKKKAKQAANISAKSKPTTSTPIATHSGGKPKLSSAAGMSKQKHVSTAIAVVAEGRQNRISHGRIIPSVSSGSSTSTDGADFTRLTRVSTHMTKTATDETQQTLYSDMYDPNKPVSATITISKQTIPSAPSLAGSVAMLHKTISKYKAGKLRRRNGANVPSPPWTSAKSDPVSSSAKSYKQGNVLAILKRRRKDFSNTVSKTIAPVIEGTQSRTLHARILQSVSSGSNSSNNGADFTRLTRVSTRMTKTPTDEIQHTLYSDMYDPSKPVSATLAILKQTVTNVPPLVGSVATLFKNVSKDKFGKFRGRDGNSWPSPPWISTKSDPVSSSAKSYKQGTGLSNLSGRPHTGTFKSMPPTRDTSTVRARYHKTRYVANSWTNTPTVREAQQSIERAVSGTKSRVTDNSALKQTVHRRPPLVDPTPTSVVKNKPNISSLSKTVKVRGTNGNSLPTPPLSKQFYKTDKPSSNNVLQQNRYKKLGSSTKDRPVIIRPGGNAASMPGPKPPFLAAKSKSNFLIGNLFKQNKVSIFSSGNDKFSVRDMGGTKQIVSDTRNKENMSNLDVRKISSPNKNRGGSGKFSNKHAGKSGTWLHIGISGRPEPTFATNITLYPKSRSVSSIDKIHDKKGNQPVRGKKTVHRSKHGNQKTKIRKQLARSRKIQNTGSTNQKHKVIHDRNTRISTLDEGVRQNIASKRGHRISSFNNRSGRMNLSRRNDMRHSVSDAGKLSVADSNPTARVSDMKTQNVHIGHINVKDKTTSLTRTRNSKKRHHMMNTNQRVKTNILAKDKSTKENIISDTDVETRAPEYKTEKTRKSKQYKMTKQRKEKGIDVSNNGNSIVRRNHNVLKTEPANGIEVENQRHSKHQHNNNKPGIESSQNSGKDISNMEYSKGDSRVPGLPRRWTYHRKGRLPDGKLRKKQNGPFVKHSTKLNKSITTLNKDQASHLYRIVKYFVDAMSNMSKSKRPLNTGPDRPGSTDTQLNDAITNLTRKVISKPETTELTKNVVDTSMQRETVGNRGRMAHGIHQRVEHPAILERPRASAKSTGYVNNGIAKNGYHDKEQNATNYPSEIGGSRVAAGWSIRKGTNIHTKLQSQGPPEIEKDLGTRDGRSGQKAKAQRSCNKAPVCASDTYTYLSDCYIPQGVTKLCDGFCPCSTNSAPSFHNNVPRPDASSRQSPEVAAWQPFPLLELPNIAAGTHAVNGIDGNNVNLPTTVSQPQYQYTEHSTEASCSEQCGVYYQPVCTAHGSTFDNQCLQQCSGEPMECQGPCPCEQERSRIQGDYCNCDPSEYNPVCTSDGEQFNNGCIAVCQGKAVACTSHCPC